MERTSTGRDAGGGGASGGVRRRREEGAQEGACSGSLAGDEGCGMQGTSGGGYVGDGNPDGDHSLLLGPLVAQWQDIVLRHVLPWLDPTVRRCKLESVLNAPGFSASEIEISLLPSFAFDFNLRHHATDLALLSRAGSGCRAAVLASGLPRAGVYQGDYKTCMLSVSRFATSVELFTWAQEQREPPDCPPGRPVFHIIHGRPPQMKHVSWDEVACDAATGGGNLEVLQWARCGLADNARHVICPSNLCLLRQMASYDLAGSICWALGRGSAGVRGALTRVLALRRTGTWRCCSGRGSRGVRGTQRPVRAPLRAGICRFCSGRGNEIARGMIRFLSTPLTAGTWRCCSGRGSTACLGAAARCIPTLLQAGIWRCCSG